MGSKEENGKKFYKHINPCATIKWLKNIRYGVDPYLILVYIQKSRRCREKSYLPIYSNSLLSWSQHEERGFHT